MSFDVLSETALNYFPCKYAGSKLAFRGPKKDLSRPYVAFFGGTELYGKFVVEPFIDRVDVAIEETCVNFGCLNAGVDVFFRDPFLTGAANNAALTILQVLPACNLSNRLYVVHPRRNDRFVNATDRLTELYPEVDFAAFNFTRHMLKTLREVCPKRYGDVAYELHVAWVARMKNLLVGISSPVLLLWVSARAPDTGNSLDLNPMHVTRSMLDEVIPQAAGFVDATLSERSLAAGTKGMVFNDLEAAAASEMLGPQAHQEVADRLLPAIKGFLQDRMDEPGAMTGLGAG